MINQEGFYRRPLPQGLIAFSSPEGRVLFREALAAGTMEGFFGLAEQFHTQAEPAFCGLGSLVVALNALEIDPGRLWKGSWRWYSEDLLDCCLPLEVVSRQGISLDELGCLARCNGADVELCRASEFSLEAFRSSLLAAAAASREPVLVVSYSRKALRQTGEGHFSPIGGYHAGRDLALVLDVARFKYPSHWAPVEALYQAMLPVDPATGRSRGYMLLRRSVTPGVLVFRVVRDRAAWHRLEHLLCEELPVRYATSPPSNVEETLRDLASGLSDEPSFPVQAILEELTQPTLIEYREAIAALRQELRGTALYLETRPALAPGQSSGEQADAFAEVMTLLLLVLADVLQRIWPASVSDLLSVLVLRSPLPPLLAGEVGRLREQVRALRLLEPAGCITTSTSDTA